MMSPQSRILIVIAAALSAAGSGCLAHHLGLDPIKHTETDLVKAPSPSAEEKPAKSSAAEKSTETAKGATEPKSPAAPSSKAMDGAMGPLPQIIGPNHAAPPIAILPPQSYPGAPNALDGIQGPQPLIVVNPLFQPTFPPLPFPTVQPNPAAPPQNIAPAYFPAPLPQPLIPAAPLLQPVPNEGTNAMSPASIESPPGNWSKSLRDALKELERELAATKSKGDKHESVDSERARKAIVVRLLRLAAGDQEGAVRRLEELPPDEQDFWAHQLHALGISLDPDGQPVASRRAALALRELRQATARLASQATLEVRNLTFCSEVTGYGHFTRFPRIEFEPEQEVLLYAEIDNLGAAETKAGFRTNFQATLQVLDATGKVVYDHNYPAGEDVCTSRRRDFFVPFRTYLPKLSPGEYTLQLTVEDTQAKKFGHSTISFRMKRA